MWERATITSMGILCMAMHTLWMDLKVAASHEVEWKYVLEGDMEQCVMTHGITKMPL